MNSKQSFFDLFMSGIYPRPRHRPEIDMAYRKRDERISVVDVELGVSHRSGGLCGRHDGQVKPISMAINMATVYKPIVVLPRAL